jgi:hypothetical protein
VNLSDRAQAVRLSAADAVTTADGVFTLAGDAERPRGVGAWVEPDVERVVLAPREQRRVGVTVREPAGTPPGDYAGGLVAQPDGPAREGTSGGVAVRVLERVGLRVYVTVPGRRDGTVAIEGLRAEPRGAGGVRGALGLPGAIAVSFRVAHRGNVGYARLGARVELTSDGAVRAVRAVDLGTLLPGGARDAAVALPVGGWRPRGYRVRVTVGAVPEARAQAAVDVGAGRILGAGGVVVGLAGIGSVGLWRRARRAG